MNDLYLLNKFGDEEHSHNTEVSDDFRSISIEDAFFSDMVEVIHSGRTWYTWRAIKLKRKLE